MECSKDKPVIQRALDPAAADKLAGICGLFGSSYDSERATAAAMANRLLQSRGLTWRDLLRSQPESVEDMIASALYCGDLTPWEEGFLRGIQGRQYLTAKQLDKLANLAAKARGRKVAP